MNGTQLKNSILQLAIQGKLVPQDPNDEPASKLIDKINHVRNRLVKEGELRKKDLMSEPILEDEIPFDLPIGWTWVRMNDLAAYRKGPFGSSLTKSMFVPKGDNSVKVYEQKNAIQKDYSLGEYYISNEKYNTMTSFTVQPLDIIVSCAGTIGEAYQIPEEAPTGIINQALMRVRLYEPDMANYWILFFADMLNHNVAMKGAGSAIKNIPPFEVLKNIIVPVPPIEEQKRIYERFQQLMPLVEEYDKAQTKLDDINEKLPDALKKSILQEAIQGKLVPQDPNDEPASVLLERIHQQKLQLVKEGKLKKKDIVSEPITDEEKPFDIPKEWVWCRLRDIIILLSGQDLTPDRYFETEKGIPYITGASHFINGNLIISRWTDTPTSVSHLGDLLITCKGTVGSMAYNKIGDIHIARQIMAITPIIIYLPYIQYYLSYIVPELEKQAHSIIPGISRDVLLSSIIPLPPLSEQQRIVAKIEELFSILK